jgi:hypothetical protein
VIHKKNGGIHMSQFEEPLNLDDFTTDDKNKQNLNEDIFNQEDNHLLLNTEELEDLDDNTYYNKSMENTKNKTTKNNITSTNDNDKKLPANDNTTTNHKPVNQEEIINKAMYRYGRKGSMTASTFKKYQAPFKTKQNNLNSTENRNTNDDVDQLILSILHKKKMNQKNNEKDNENTNINNMEKNHETINNKSIGADENLTNKTDNQDNINYNNTNTHTPIPTPPHTRKQTPPYLSPITNKITPLSTRSITHNQ